MQTVVRGRRWAAAANQERVERIGPSVASKGAARAKKETATATFISKLSCKCQTVIPRELRVLLDLKPGDVIRYREVDAGIAIEKLPAVEHTTEDELRAFNEWDSSGDEAAFGHL